MEGQASGTAVAKRTFPYSVTGADGSQASHELALWAGEGLIPEEVDVTEVDAAALMASLQYVEAHPPTFAVGDSDIKIPGWRGRTLDEPLSLPEKTVGIKASSPTGLVLTDSVDDMPEIARVFPEAHTGEAPRSSAGLLVIVGAMLIVYAASATTATAAHAVFRKDATAFLNGNAGSPAYHLVLSLLSHVFSTDLRRGAGSTRIWAVSGAIYGGALGLAHLIVNNRVSMGGMTPALKDAVMRVFTSLTKRTMCELGACCTDIAEYLEALESAPMQHLASALSGLKCGNLCVAGDPANTSLLEVGVDAEAFRREVFALRGLIKASNPDKLLALRGDKISHLLKNPAVAAVVAQNRRASSRFQGITAAAPAQRAARQRGRAEA